MANTGMQVWSQTAATNASVNSNVNWAEGQAPSSVNDSARAAMASAAKWVSDNNGTLVTSGSTTAYTVATNQVESALTDGYTVSIKFHATNDTSATLAVDGLAAAPLQIRSGVNIGAAEFCVGSIHRFTFSSTAVAWLENSGIAPATVRYNKIQIENDATLLGNTQGASWVPQEITIGTGLVISTTSTSTSQSAWTPTSTSTAIAFTLSAPNFPPTAAFKNLSIKVTGTSSATAAADFATLATSGSSQFQTLALSGNINLGANGSVNQLDAGSLASGTWYAVWGIANAAGSLQGFLASTSFTTPLLPSGYTYKARLGTLITSTSTASAQLMGTWQYGRQVQYVVGLAATAVQPTISASVGSAWTAYSVSNMVPTTASRVKIQPVVSNTHNNSAGYLILAPNNSYSTSLSSAPYPPFISYLSVPNYGAPMTIIQSALSDLLLESTSIYAGASGATAELYCIGYEDNI